MSLDRLTAALADRYRIERELGAGGMATVYLARDLKHDRHVAIKVLHQDLGATLGPERFLAEIKTTARLQHPHILPLLDSGSTAGEGNSGGLLYYVMPYVEGETLRDRLTRDTQLPIEDAVRIAREVADALGYAHGHGVIHRDIKPENILLQGGHALVADFGIALAVQQAGGGRLTQTGLSLGTPHYMAPEQSMGEKTIDHRADLYSLGAVAYEMLTGEPPFTGATGQAIAARVMSGRPMALTALRDTVPEHVSAAVMKSLSKLPADRFESAARFAEALTGPWAEAATHRSRTPARTRWRDDWRLLLVTGVATVALASLGYLLWQPGAGEGRSAGIVFSQKTFQHEAIFNARFAPDGQTIVFSAAAEGSTPRLFVIRPDYPEPQRFGPDSTHLLAVASTGEIAILLRATYLTHRLFRGMLARMPIGGGAPREVLADVREADWSPDGNELAIIHEVGGKDRLEYPIGHALYEAPGYLSDLRVAPGGDAIVFFEHPNRWDDRGDVVLIDLRGSRTVLASDFNGLEGLAWSADGNTVLFSGAVEGGLFQVRAVNRRGLVRRALANAGPLTMQDVAGNGRWIVTRDDQRTRIVFNSPEAPGGRDLSWLDLPHLPILSADGRWLAFSDQSSLGGTNYTAMVRRTDGSPAVRLGEGSPQGISADGGWVVAVVPTTPNRLVLYPVGAGDSRPLDLPDMRRYSGAQFFRDGKRMLICGSKAAGASTCYVQSLAGGPPRPVTPEGTEYARVSPDGRFVIAAEIGRGFRIHGVDGGAPRDLPMVSPNEYVASWSPDGRAIWVQSSKGLGAQIDQVDIATGRRSPLFRIDPTDRSALVGIILPAMADDHRYYAYEMVTYESRIFVVEGAR